MEWKILKRPKNFSGYLFVIFTVFMISPIISQETSSGKDHQYSLPPQITLLGEISNQSLIQKNPNFAQKLLRFFAGNRSPALIKPFNLAVTQEGVIYVLDQGAQTIKMINPEQTEIKDLELEKPIKFPSPVGICLDKNGQLYWTDSQLGHIYSWKPGSKEVTIFSKGVELLRPTGIAYSSVTDEFWVVESEAHRISIFDTAGNRIRTLGTRGKGPGEFNFPVFIWIDAFGHAYVVDSMNFRVQVFDSSGALLSTFGEIGDATGYFARPKGIATDSDGHIYVVDALFHTVQVFDINGKFLANFGVHGNKEGEFWLPTGIFIDSHDRIYIADSYNQRIQIYKYTSGEKDEY